jgi:hypothetical protein
MRRTVLALTIVAGAVGGTTLAHHGEHVGVGAKGRVTAPVRGDNQGDAT